MEINSNLHPVYLLMPTFCDWLHLWVPLLVILHVVDADDHRSFVVYLVVVCVRCICGPSLCSHHGRGRLAWCQGQSWWLRDHQTIPRPLSTGGET